MSYRSEWMYKSLHLLTLFTVQQGFFFQSEIRSCVLHTKLVFFVLHEIVSLLFRVLVFQLKYCNLKFTYDHIFDSWFRHTQIFCARVKLLSLFCKNKNTGDFSLENAISGSSELMHGNVVVVFRFSQNGYIMDNRQKGWIVIKWHRCRKKVSKNSHNASLDFFSLGSGYFVARNFCILFYHPFAKSFSAFSNKNGTSQV